MYRQIRQRMQMCLILWAALAGQVQASSQLALPSASRFSRVDIEQGLSQATVTALAQDLHGNIWVGTQNGLNRYDGFDVKIFRPDERQSLALTDNFVTSLAVDQQGVVWVGTLNGLNRFDPQQGVFERILLAPRRADDDNDDVILSLHLDQQNRLWVGTERGVALWQPHSKSLQLWLATAKPGTTPTQQQNITAISTDNSGNLWLGTPQGLSRYDIASQTEIPIEHFPFKHPSVMALWHDSADRLWVGLEYEGLLLWQPNSQHWSQIPLASYENGVTSKEIRSITMDQTGDIWVGTQHGLNRLTQQAGRWQQTASFHHQRNNPDSLGSGKVVSILADQQGSIWAGTWNGGVSRFNPANNLFTSITPDLALMAIARNPATIGLATSHHKMWAGTADGLFELDLSNNRFTLVGNGQHSYTFYCALPLGEEFWFGHAQGIKSVNIHNADYRDIALPDAVPRGPVRRLWANEQQVWLAIEQYGIVVLDRALTTVIALQPFSRAITFIRPIDQRFMLVGSYNGLSWFDRQTTELVFSHKLGTAEQDELPALPTAPMAYVEGHDGRRWLATNGSGLHEMQHDGAITDPANVRFIQYAEAEGLASGQLKSMELDKNGNLWLSNAFGISAFNPTTAQFINFGARHGTLRRDYINNASSRFADGRIVFGGMDGFTLFEPEQVLAYQPGAIAIPQVQHISVNGAELPIDERGPDAALARVLYHDAKLIIPATGQRSVSFAYSTREFIETQQVQFQYRLDPLTPDWITQTGTNRSISFERLPPGSYQLRLRAGLPQTQWSDEFTLPVEVQPLWWETTVARLLFITFFVSLLLGVHVYRLAHLHKRQADLARLVDQRTEALHDKTQALQESKNRAEQTLQQLATTMKELVRTEKMAALGQLVAGVAHEVNTPLGVALTANSVVSEECRQLLRKLQEGNIRRQELDAFLQKLTQAARLLDSNLHRAANLVANFKQVSVDRTADNQRQFNLADYLGELLESLSLMWKNRQVTISVNCPDNIIMDSYPGTIGQIITNFTQNAIIHAFKDRSNGAISISCAQRDSQVEIVFADNGVGIDTEIIERIFDPFFTTNRHQGGTGLGLHIVYNLITQNLRGTVSVSSSPDSGSRFTLLLPLKV